jgi:4-hydroxybenzoate polyprenyltransferase
MFWVAGFDIIYALQDEDFDKSNDLYSIPVLLGKQKGLILARVLHILSAVMLVTTMTILSKENNHINWISYTGAAVFISMLIYQHTLVKANDLSKINLAFFTTNGIASIIIGILIILDILII